MSHLRRVAAAVSPGYSLVTKLPIDPGESLRTRGPRKLAMTWTAYAGLAIGVTLFAWVILYEGAGAVAQVLGQAGWGIVAIALCHLPSVWADAMAWRRLLRTAGSPPLRSVVWARWIGESINDLLPVMQVGGNVAKAWLLVKRGVPLAPAGASVVVDVTLVVLSQIIFTLVGLVLLAPRLGQPGVAAVVLVVSALMGLLLWAFYLAQRRGFFGAIARVSRRILGGWDLTSMTSGAEAIDSSVAKLYRDPRTLAGAGLWHLLSWVLGTGEVWLGLRLLGHPVDLWTALLIESLGQAIRTGSFAVPGALGVQEGGYVLLGNGLGIAPQVSLAL